MVSAAAQLHQVDNIELAGILARLQSSSETSGDEIKDEQETVVERISFFSGLSLGSLHLGLNYGGRNINNKTDYLSLDPSITLSGVNSKSNTVVNVLNPQIAFTLMDMITIGAEHFYANQKSDGRIDLNQQVYSIALHIAGIEAGMSYSPRGPGSGGREFPSTTSLFARFHLLPMVGFGFDVKKFYSRRIWGNDYKDYTVVALDVIISAGMMNLEIYAESESASFENANALRDGTIPTNTYGIIAYFDVLDSAIVGGQIASRSGSDSKDFKKAEISGLEIGLVAAISL